MLWRSAIAGSHSPTSSNPQTSSLGTMTAASGGVLSLSHAMDPIRAGGSGWSFDDRSVVEPTEPIRARNSATAAVPAMTARASRGGASSSPRRITKTTRHDPASSQEGPDRRCQELAASDPRDVHGDEKDGDPEPSSNQRCDEADDRREADDIHEWSGAEAQVHQTDEPDHGLDSAAGADERRRAHPAPRAGQATGAPPGMRRPRRSPRGRAMGEPACATTGRRTR